jgi:hypothetical protein
MWEEYVLIGETSRSWVVEFSGYHKVKLPKKAIPKGWALTPEAKVLIEQAESDARWFNALRVAVVDQLNATNQGDFGFSQRMTALETMARETILAAEWERLRSKHGRPNA